ncbi:MAG TPA: alpha/beta hydrolase [Thermoanaerobaculia bacterium]|nr:alpha/beta hydrolase [Thermoanaerobaculia bacterium]
MVLLHGFPEFWYSWRRQIPALAQAGFRAVAPDLRGYNDSPKPASVADYRLTEVIDDVAALIERLGAPCAVVGHDWGGLAAWYLAMSRPDLVRKLVVLNMPHPAPFLRELRRSKSQKLRMAYQLFFQPPLIPELLMPWLLPLLLRRAGRFTRDELRVYKAAWRKKGARRGMANYYRAIRRYRGELKPLIRKLDVPALIIWGVKEVVFTPETLEGTEEWVPALRIVKVAGAGHFVQTDEPEIVNDLLIEFLGAPSPEPRPTASSLPWPA